MSTPLLASELLISAATTEIFVFVVACTVLCADLYIPRHYRPYLHWLTIAALLLSAMMTVGDFGEERVRALNGFFVADSFTAVLKTTMLLAAAGALAFSRNYLQLSNMLRGEFHALAMFAVLGMLVMISAGHFLSLYIGLELMSLSLYAMIAMRSDNALSLEAAIKYFVLGALASGLFLYGISLIYGATGGKLYLNEVALAVAAGGDGHTTLILGLVFALSGLAFKLGAAPFHMWLPDVYHGAPAPMTLFIASAPKVAALAMMMRVLAESLSALQGDWRDMLIVLAIASLAVGNITAIAQTNIKRMLAYSAIAHSGFMILGVLAGAEGLAAAVFYIMAYALMTVGGFGVVVLLSTETKECDELDDMRGLATRNGLAAGVMLLLMFSMAGLPPVVGFAAKLSILQAVAKADLIWLAVVAVLLSVVGAFYYLRVVKLMYFDAATKDEKIILPIGGQVMLGIIGTLVLLLGLFPDSLLSVCETAIVAFLQ